MATGLVTTAAAAPPITSATARSIEAIAAGALVASGLPGSAVAGMPSATTGSARAKAAAAFAGVDDLDRDVEAEPLGAPRQALRIGENVERRQVEFARAAARPRA